MGVEVDCGGNRGKYRTSEGTIHGRETQDNGLVGFNHTVDEIIDPIASLHKTSTKSWWTISEGDPDLFGPYNADVLVHQHVGPLWSVRVTLDHVKFDRSTAQ